LAIKTLRISNYKAFADIDVTLGNFNVLVGANASGKTSLIQIFRFVRDVALYDLDNAISLQGGVKYLRNMKLGKSRQFRVELVTDQASRFRVRRDTHKDGHAVARTKEVTHSLALAFKSRGQNFDIVEDTWLAKLELSHQPRHRDESSNGGAKPAMVELTVSNLRGHLRAKTKAASDVTISAADIIPAYISDVKLPPHQTLAFGVPYILNYLAERPSSDFFRSIGLYDFDPKLPKRAVQITGKAELDEDGSNLSLVLRNVIQDKEKRRKFSNLLKEMLPFVEDLDVENFSDKSLFVQNA